MVFDLANNIKDYDFNELLLTNSKKYLEQRGIKNYINKHGKQGLLEFVEEFWENPSKSLIELKEKYNIANNIGYSDIIKAFPNNTYAEFLKSCWDTNVEIDDIVKLYAMEYNKIQKLFLPLIYKTGDLFCPECLESNVFLIESNVNEVKSGIYEFKCSKCLKINIENKLLDKEEIQLEKEIRTKRYNEFILDTEVVKNKLLEIKCPKCQSEDFDFLISKEEKTYEIICKYCRVHWDDIAQLNIEYENWKQRAAMMIAIKAREESLIEEKLKEKSIENIKLVSEEIISETECYDAVSSMMESAKKGGHDWWVEIFNNIKRASRTEVVLLIEIAKLCSESNNKTTWSNNITGEKLELISYLPKEPIIFVLLEKTGFLNIRKVLRKLINKKLIVCCEEGNYIHISNLIIENLGIIKELLRPQDIVPEIRYLIFRKNNFTCYHCGETGRPLRIGYLDINKNINDLNSMVPICDICFDDITENELLIDGTITHQEFIKDNHKTVAWDFVTNCYPDLTSNKELKNEIYNMTLDYNEDMVINALAITINKIEKEEIHNSIQSLRNYTKGILRNSGDYVKVSKFIEEKYQLARWTKG